MTYKNKRLATDEERLWACFVAKIPADEVAEVWFDGAGNFEIVLKGYIDRVTVSTTFDAKEKNA